jgi:hypothetical protein
MRGAPQSGLSRLIRRISARAARLRNDSRRDATQAENTPRNESRWRKDNSQSINQIRICGTAAGRLVPLSTVVQAITRLPCLQSHSGRFVARNSSMIMRSRALVVRSISSCRRGCNDVIECVAVSLPNRSSTHVCAHDRTVLTMPMSIHHRPYCSFIAVQSTSRRPFCACQERWSSIVRLPPWCGSARLVHRPSPHTISHHCRCESGAEQTLVWLDRELVARAIFATPSPERH